MHYKSVKGFSGWGQLGILLVFTALGIVIAALVQFLIGMQLVPSGMPVSKMGEEMIKAMMKPENVNYARLSQVLGTFFFSLFRLYYIS